MTNGKRQIYLDFIVTQVNHPSYDKRYSHIMHRNTNGGRVGISHLGASANPLVADGVSG